MHSSKQLTAQNLQFSVHVNHVRTVSATVIQIQALSHISVMQTAQFYRSSLCHDSLEVCCQGVYKFREGLSGGSFQGGATVILHITTAVEKE